MDRELARAVGIGVGLVVGRFSLQSCFVVFVFVLYDSLSTNNFWLLCLQVGLGE